MQLECSGVSIFARSASGVCGNLQTILEEKKIRTREGEKNRWPTTFRYSINKSTMSELRKAVIKNADMTEDMQQVRALRNVF